jgi:solute carrier family 25 folate transporter 32
MFTFSWNSPYLKDIESCYNKVCQVYSNSDRRTKEFVAGSISGATAAIATAPLELVKTILQSGTDRKSPSSWSILKNVVRQGGFKACFRGLSPTLTALVPHNGLYLLAYSECKKSFSFDHDVMTNATSAMAAGGLANLVTNPLWVVKTKMTSNPTGYYGVVQSLRKIVKHEGSRALNSGVGASMLGVSHVMIQFPLYEAMKDQLAELDQFNSASCTGVVMISSVASKAVAGLLTYPLETIRTRKQVFSTSSHKQILKDIIKNQGMRGFYKGMTASLIKSIPATAITLCLYENLLQI